MLWTKRSAIPFRIPESCSRDPAPGLAAADFCVGDGPRSEMLAPLGPAATDFAAARTSVSVTRPSGPEPLTAARSTPSSAAIRRATGEALTRASSSLFCAGSRVGRSDAVFSPRFPAGDTPAATGFFSEALFSCGGAVSFSLPSAGAGFSVSACSFFGSSVFASFSGGRSFFRSFSGVFFSSSGAASPGSPMNAIRWPTSTLPPSST